MLVCRACRRALSLKQGCEICGNDRKVLRRAYGDIFVEEDTLDTAVAKIIELLLLNLERLEEDMRCLSDKGNDFQGLNDKHVRMASDLAKALSAAATQARALEKEKDKKAKSMSTEKKAELMVEFFSRQPRERQDDMVKAFRAEYKGGKWVG